MRFMAHAHEKKDDTSQYSLQPGNEMTEADRWLEEVMVSLTGADSRTRKELRNFISEMESKVAAFHAMREPGLQVADGKLSLTEV